MAGEIISSTGQGAAAGAMAGSVIPGIGTAVGGIIGGGLGFISGLFSSNANKKAERLEAQKIEWTREGAAISNLAREAGITANALATDLQRKQFAQKAYLATEGTRAGEVMSNLIGSSIAKNARASIMAQEGSNLQFSHSTQAWGRIISDLQQQATDASLGIKAQKDKEEAIIAQLGEQGIAGFKIDLYS